MEILRYWFLREIIYEHMERKNSIETAANNTVIMDGTALLAAGRVNHMILLKQHLVYPTEWGCPSKFPKYGRGHPKNCRDLALIKLCKNDNLFALIWFHQNYTISLTERQLCLYHASKYDKLSICQYMVHIYSDNYMRMRKYISGLCEDVAAPNTKKWFKDYILQSCHIQIV